MGAPVSAVRTPHGVGSGARLERLRAASPLLAVDGHQRFPLIALIGHSIGAIGTGLEHHAERLSVERAGEDRTLRPVADRGPDARARLVLRRGIGHAPA